MKVHYLAKSIVVCLLLAVTSPSMANEFVNSPAIDGAAETRVAQLNNRLEEIKAMDRRTLSKTEKKELRREVRQIKKELAAISGGVYLSIGAIILIALLLILLL